MCGYDFQFFNHPYLRVGDTTRSFNKKIEERPESIATCLIERKDE